ncbi:hypothetical protein OG948_01295 [Embleya sp. NBC_00888]|nr:hypothetical protein OG948_01295 [Embleya sp. NBC_00888]
MTLPAFSCDEPAELVAEARRLTAPKRLVKAYEAENALPDA